MSTTLPPTEAERLQALAKFALLDTAPEPEFERITAHAARIFRVPLALVSLVDADRQWFKSHHGTTLCETPRDHAFCAHTIFENWPLVVSDTRLDARFAGNPFVTGEPFVRFYAGAPLTTREGANIGSLCLLDTLPRSFSEADQDSLAELAGRVMAAIEARLTEQRLRGEIAVHEQTTKALREVEARTSSGDTLWDGLLLDVTEHKRADERLRMLESSIDNANDAILITEAEPTDLPGPRIRYANRAFTRMSGYTEEEVLGQTPRMFQGLKTDPETRRKIREALKVWQPVRVELIESPALVQNV